jgi:hypothetical protein
MVLRFKVRTDGEIEYTGNVPPLRLNVRTDGEIDYTGNVPPATVQQL